MKHVYILFICIPIISFGQTSKRTLDHATYDIWNTLQETSISNDGKWVAYKIQPGQGDPSISLVDHKGNLLSTFDRARNLNFSWDSKHLFFRISAPFDSVRNMRRRKVEEEALPKDTLAILNLETQAVVKIPNVKSYHLPEEWSGHMAYLLDPIKLPEDSTAADSTKVAVKPNDDDNGYTLILRDLSSARQDTFRYVLDHKFSKHGNSLTFQSSGDSTFIAGIYHVNCKKETLKPLFRSQGKFNMLTISEDGGQVAFTADIDTTKHTIRYHALHYWNQNLDSAMLIADTTLALIKNDWLIGEHDSLYFSESGERLFFTISPEPLLPDTTLLEEEIVDVEVWNYKDQRLHTQQNIELKVDRKKGYVCMYSPADQQFVQLATEAIPDVVVPDEGNAAIAFGTANDHYLNKISWEGFPVRKDIFAVDINNGAASRILENMRSYRSGSSPTGNYFYWIDTNDSAWYVYSAKEAAIENLTAEIGVQFTNEIHDAPTPPSPYGIAGWTEKDEFILIYDRYDIWKIDPTGSKSPVNLTQGRKEKLVYRYLKLDPRARYIDSKEDLLLHTYNEITRKEGYASLNLRRNSLPVQVIEDDFKFSRPVKALEADQLVYAKERFEVFPDLYLSDIGFKGSTQISDANPQQAEYVWGKAELMQWTSLDGQELEGMVFKPDNFDPSKKYPLLVNFYEKSSDELHDHKYPKPERSTINYALYVSNGYIIFNPNVHYRIGYPGESCYNSVIPGITKLIDQGYIDKDRIGVQGHSWGGYQIAYLVTKTDMFAAAEAGAPVPNMISAYGGIRWWTGLSRMFQYEHTQSRIGGTLWEYPVRFIENSPIFFVDKINTPLLIMHNDADGHVPWYQGIELFVALRRLGKPSWMLNYVGEPHWPLKRQNQIDFNIRMMQYFDHFLKGAPEPAWMKTGVPAIEKGINLGYELTEE